MSQFSLPKNSKILNYCQLWTHGFNADREIKIGNIEIGENVILSKGSIHYLTKEEIDNNREYLSERLNKEKEYLADNSNHKGISVYNNKEFYFF